MIKINNKIKPEGWILDEITYNADAGQIEMLFRKTGSSPWSIIIMAVLSIIGSVIAVMFLTGTVPAWALAGIGIIILIGGGLLTYQVANIVAGEIKIEKLSAVNKIFNDKQQQIKNILDNPNLTNEQKQRRIKEIEIDYNRLYKDVIIPLSKDEGDKGLFSEETLKYIKYGVFGLAGLAGLAFIYNIVQSTRK